MLKFFTQPIVRFFLGIFMCVFFPAWILWVLPYGWLVSSSFLHKLSFFLVFLSFLLSYYSIRITGNFPGEKNNFYILYHILFWYMLDFVFLLYFRMPYSLSYLTLSLIFAVSFFYLNYIADKELYRFSSNLLLLPLGRASELEEIHWIQWQKIEQPKLPNKIPRAIVADLHSPELSFKWQEFLADCTLKGIPVYNIRQIEESLTGKIKINHMYENDLGSLLPSIVYSFWKQVLDTIAVLLALPIVIPVLLLIAIAIKLDSKGGVFFNQKRIGKGGKDFVMYKFRTMRTDTDKYKPTETEDNRITMVGRILRKFRFDELPQLFNVLKGEMSLIGPRPEYKPFAEKLNKEVPFYKYRSIVKPGISGWAQVMHGHATGADETKVKIQYDFYYIKNFSITLDILIFFKTIKTIFSGFGAK